METLRTLFEQYGLLLVFGAVFVEQVGPPLPSGPLLVVAGALATEGHLSAWLVAAVAWGAGMLGKVALCIVGRVAAAAVAAYFAIKWWRRRRSTKV